MSHKTMCTDERFVELFTTMGAAATARMLGVGERAVYRRRKHLEEKLETGDHGVVVLCNEDGLSKGFDFNPVATSMIGINLVGPVIVCDARLFE